MCLGNQFVAFIFTVAIFSRNCMEFEFVIHELDYVLGDLNY